MTPASALPQVDSLPVEPRRLLDVPGALNRVHTVGEYIAVRAGASEMDRALYTIVQENNDGTENHFQGFQRLHDGRHFVISGGNWHPNPRGSEMYIGRLGSATGGGPWLSNLTDGSRIPETDRIVRGITVDPVLWHGGGMDVCGPVLAIAVEHNGSPGKKLLLGAGRAGRKAESAVYFFDMSDPEKPRIFRNRIHREGVKAGAVALTRLASGHYLCGVWSDSDSLPMRLDFYVSKRTDTFDGDFHQHDGAIRRWLPNKDEPTQRALKFQAMSFVRDADGQLYLIGLGLDGKKHTAEIYRVHIPGVHEPTTGVTGIMDPLVERLISSRDPFECDIKQCDMRGASGVYVESELIIYSGAQYRGDKPGDPVRFAEFRAPMLPVSHVSINSAWVELYAEPQHRGARLTLRDLSRAVANYKKVRVNGEPFGDRARSAKYQLPVGLDYVLFEDRDFERPIIRLKGTGHVGVEPDFAVLANKVSSSRLESQA